jgi:hypothetical protein
MSDDKPPAKDDYEDDSDVEIEGMDLDDGDEEEEVFDASNDADAEEPLVEDEAADEKEKLANEDHDEMEAAKRERIELMEAERKQVAAPDENSSSAEERLQYLLAQSEVFAHFLAGTYSATVVHTHCESNVNFTRSSLLFRCFRSQVLWLPIPKRAKKDREGKKEE